MVGEIDLAEYLEIFSMRSRPRPYSECYSESFRVLSVTHNRPNYLSLLLWPCNNKCATLLIQEQVSHYRANLPWETLTIHYD